MTGNTTGVEHGMLTPPRGLRLQLLRSTSAPGRVTGAWWPHSRDLVAELGELVQTIMVTMPSLERVGYHSNEWDRPVPRKTLIAGRVLRMEGFTVWPPDTVRLAGAGAAVIVTVIAPEADPRQAHTAMMDAAGRTAVHRAHIRAGHQRVRNDNQLHAAEHDWDSEGGHLPRTETT